VAGGQQPQHLQLPLGQGLDQPGWDRDGLARRCLRGRERLDDLVQVLGRRTRASRGTTPLAGADEAAQQGGHRRPLVGEDADVPFLPGQGERLGQQGEGALMVPGRLQGQ